MGRPSRYSKAIITKICGQLADGIPLEEICRQPNMPDAQTIYGWSSTKRRPASVPDSVRQDIARARDLGFDAIANRLRLTARASAGGESTGDILRDKLIIETDLKLLAKWSTRYGDKTTIAGDPNNPVRVLHTTDDAAIIYMYIQTLDHVDAKVRFAPRPDPSSRAMQAATRQAEEKTDE